MNRELENRVALVTGGTRGIGRAIALALADEGCNVAVFSRDPVKRDDAVKSILARGVLALGLEGDARNWLVDIGYAITRIKKEWERLDILVNNVGGGGRWGGGFLSTEDGIWQEVNDKNLMAAVRFTRLALPLMEKQGWGRVVTISSLFGCEVGGRPWFAATKAAEIAFMKTMASDSVWQNKNITFNTVCPGHIKVGNPNEWDWVGPWGEPEDVAHLVAFLCSDKARWINGSCIVVDGGRESRSF